MNTINKNDKFVACWGYDQTQYSIYNVVGVKGKSVFVEGLNGWSGISESDLAVGSKVKVFEFLHWSDLTDEQRADYTSRNYDRVSYEHHEKERIEKETPVRTIVKMNRINGESWSYIWTLDNGEIVNSKETYKNNQFIRIINGLKKCIVKEGYNGTPQIKIDSVIRASLDNDFNNNVKRYAEQNEYTAYNGR